MRQKTDQEPSPLTLNFKDGDLLYGTAPDREKAMQEIQEHHNEEPYNVMDFGMVDIYNNSIGFLASIVRYDQKQKTFVDNSQEFQETYRHQRTTFAQQVRAREERVTSEFEKNYQNAITAEESHNVNKMKKLLSDSDEERDWRLHREGASYESLGPDGQLSCKTIRSLCKDGIDFARINNKKVHFIVPALDDEDAWSIILFKTILQQRYEGESIVTGLTYLPITTSELRYALKLALREKGEHIIFYDGSKSPMREIEKQDILEKFKNYKKHEDFIIRDKNMEIFNKKIAELGIINNFSPNRYKNKFTNHVADFVRIEQRLRSLSDKDLAAELKALCIKIKTCDSSLDVEKALNAIFVTKIQASSDAATPISHDLSEVPASGEGNLTQSKAPKGISKEKKEQEPVETTLQFKKRLECQDDSDIVNDKNSPNAGPK